MVIHFKYVIITPNLFYLIIFLNYIINDNYIFYFSFALHLLNRFATNVVRTKNHGNLQIDLIFASCAGNQVNKCKNVLKKTALILHAR